MHRPLRWHWVVTTAIALLFMAYAAFGIFAAYKDGRATDFLSYWAAARMTLAGEAASAYEIDAHHRVEETVAPMGDVQIPFPYPPPFLFFVAPFGLLKFWAALAGWVAATGAFYVFMCRRIAPLPYSIAHPAAAINGLVGQNGLLTTGIFIWGTGVLDKRPFLGGAILGLLIIKPQLTLLLPVAVIAGRYWTAIGGAALSVALLLLAAVLAFGTASFSGFFAILPQYVFYLQTGGFGWQKLASVFAFCRSLGIPQTAAYVIHWLVAAIAAAVTARAWWLKFDTRVPVLAAATLLMPPYIWPYDSLLLIIPAGRLIATGRGRWTIPLLWLLCFLPVVHFFGGYNGPNTVPVASVLALYLMLRDARIETASSDAAPIPATASSAGYETPPASRPGAGPAPRRSP